MAASVESLDDLNSFVLALHDDERHYTVAVEANLTHAVLLAPIEECVRDATLRVCVILPADWSRVALVIGADFNYMEHPNVAVYLDRETNSQAISLTAKTNNTDQLESMTIGSSLRDLSDTTSVWISWRDGLVIVGAGSVGDGVFMVGDCLNGFYKFTNSTKTQFDFTPFGFFLASNKAMKENELKYEIEAMTPTITPTLSNRRPCFDLGQFRLDRAFCSPPKSLPPFLEVSNPVVPPRSHRILTLFGANISLLSAVTLAWWLRFCFTVPNDEGPSGRDIQVDQIHASPEGVYVISLSITDDILAKITKNSFWSHPVLVAIHPTTPVRFVLTRQS